MAGKKANLMGKRFGILTVVGEAESDIGNNAMWLCRCDCGTVKVIRALSLKSGETSSCGCRQGKYRHGMSKTRLHRIWCHMVARCQCKTDAAYDDYGGRGISICSEWRDSFETFRDWALKNGYSKNLTIDRKDNNGDYCAENCKWSTPKEQSNNRRSNIFFEHDGKRMTVTEWVQELGLNRGTVFDRIRRGWPVEQAILIPIGVRRNA
jgi:hypothetical protein